MARGLHFIRTCPQAHRARPGRTGIRIGIVCEGQTESDFVQQVLAPHAGAFDIWLSGPVVGRPGKKGGDIRWARVEPDLRRHLSQPHLDRVTTLLDFYRLGSDFPGMVTRPTHLPAAQQVFHVESAMAAALAQGPRFIPYIQLHEFEALLFADPQAVELVTNMDGLAQALAQAASGYNSPEDINANDPPSYRILRHHPGYDKRADGVAAAREIGLPRLRAACPRFDAWLTGLGI